jgi:cytoskeletal protein CcmA (bactofilin family)
MTTPNSYDPGFVGGVTGTGQSSGTPAPSLFLESIAIDKDLSVGGSLFSTNNLVVGASAAIKGGLTAAAAAFGNAVFSGGSATLGGPLQVNADAVVKGYVKTDNLEVKEL